MITDQMTMDILINLAVFFTAYKLGQWVTAGRIARALLNIDAEEIEQIDEEIGIVLERHPEGLFAYRKDDGDFIANAATAEALFERIKDRFPGKNFRLSRPEWATEQEYDDIFNVIVKTFGS
jgi:hypothetical protein